jgi:hypothetical protein
LTTLAKAKAKTNETFIVQASFMIVPYDRQNIFIAQATGVKRRQFSADVKSVRLNAFERVIKGFTSSVTGAFKNSSILANDVDQVLML